MNQHTKKIRVLHVTEIFDSGVREFVKSIASYQSQEGADVTLMYPDRDLSGLDAHYSEIKHMGFEIKVLKKNRNRFINTVRLRRQIKQAIKSGSYDVIHLHSTFAGLAGRSIRPGLLGKVRVFYTPHGLSFLRLNSSSFARWIFLLIERILAKNTCRMVLTSHSEQSLVHKKIKPRLKTDVLKNGVDDEVLQTFARKPWLDKPKIAMIGRICYQKGPWRFQRIANEFIDQADFIWIGFREGDDPSAFGLDCSSIKILPWADKTSLIPLLDQVDILIFPTLWEGFSLSVPIAQARGIPALVSNVIGNIDSVSHEKSGYVCQSELEMINYLQNIIDTPGLYQDMSRAAILYADMSLSNRDIGKDSLELYGENFKNFVSHFDK